MFTQGLVIEKSPPPLYFIFIKLMEKGQGFPWKPTHTATVKTCPSHYQCYEVHHTCKLHGSCGTSIIRRIAWLRLVVIKHRVLRPVWHSRQYTSVGRHHASLQLWRQWGYIILNCWRWHLSRGGGWGTGKIQVLSLHSGFVCCGCCYVHVARHFHYSKNKFDW